ncbi:MAG: hypothetical protein K1563_07795 [Candidatus Thiodiazotropha sp. (ex. Lucinisca nassula)]|nr:hypothetical protein [Candidatus Thiodiazotropha sp. (ex. Lucinisca nassula)]MBW9273576.1 hypothetical protein [Candidatus Thiodiazotropha sp. (ex. Lucinisca nassula)]
MSQVIQFGEYLNSSEAEARLAVLEEMAEIEPGVLQIPLDEWTVFHRMVEISEDMLLRLCDPTPENLDFCRYKLIVMTALLKKRVGGES